MEKEQKTIGLSRELIIHPGETLTEILEDRDMTQKELAIRTGVTEKHVSTVVKGTKGISVAFAKKLEYALGIDAGFWINLQANYDREMLEFEEMNAISSEEIEVLKHLKNVIEYLADKEWIIKESDEAGRVLDLRKLLGVSNLTVIPNITYNAAYRAQIANNVNVDVYVLYAWQHICQLLTKDIEIAKELNLELLRENLPQIKKLMFEDANKIQMKLTGIFAECGIAFRIVKHFKGAPVQGFIKCSDEGRMILCMTIRKGAADIFWFSLFHEIGHIFNGDIKQKFMDFASVKGDSEAKADEFAGNILINFKDYKSFVTEGDFSLESIRMFAKKQGVQSYIVIGRLQSDGILEWNQYSQEKVYYCWAK